MHVNAVPASDARHDDPRRGDRWNLAAVAVAALTALGAAFLPTGTSTMTDSSGVVTTSHTSLVGNEGAGVLVVLVIPLLVIGAPLLLRRSSGVRVARQVVVGLLSVMVVLGALSVGVFFLPALALMVISVLTTPRTATGGPAVP